MPALPLTPEQKQDAARLKQLFQNWQADRKAKGEPSNQDAVSEMLGFGQSALSQYLNGKIPLNPTAAARFSKLLGCQIGDFSPAIAARASEIAEAAAPTSVSHPKAMEITDLSKLEMKIVLTYRQLPQASRDEVFKLLTSLDEAAKLGAGAVKRTTPKKRAKDRSPESVEH